MFDRIVGFLLRLYPGEFRRVYGRDALRLIWDRAGEERGVWLRTRLLADIVRDLVVTSLTWRPPAAELARVDGMPRFDILEPHRIRPQALMAGTLTSMLMLVSFGLLFQPRTFPPAPLQLGEGSGGDPIGAESATDEQQVVVPASDSAPPIVAMVANTLRQRYYDAAIGHQLANALLAFEKDDRYRLAGRGRALADRLNEDIYKTSRALGVPAGAFVADVVYFGGGIAPPMPPLTPEMNCLFRTIETLPGNVGHIKLDGFMPPQACQETARKTMTTINKTNALILDLRDNGGGMGETALQIADYLFDRPAFLFDPRPHSRVPTHTASPIDGNALSDKPVYLLTSARTASAAEYFTYNLKMLKRVTIVGERTAGAMHAGAFHQLNDQFGMGIQEVPPPDNPYSPKGWERIGIEPHVAVPAGQALEVAKALALSEGRRR